MWVARGLAAVGRPLAAGFSAVVELAVLLGGAVRYALVRRRRGGHVVAQLYDVGVGSLLFVCVTLGFLGMITVFQGGLQLRKVVPDYTMVGAAFLKTLVREFGPTITGLMMATRTGSGIAAEVGSMVVTEQVDALRMTNADPVDFLLVPRLIACTVMMPVLTVFGALVAALTGMLVAHAVFDVLPSTYWNFMLIRHSDVAVGLTKAVAYGVAIPVVAMRAGLAARGGSEGVGTATTRAVVGASFAVIVLDLLISVVAFRLGGA